MINLTPQLPPQFPSLFSGLSEQSIPTETVKMKYYIDESTGEYWAYVESTPEEEIRPGLRRLTPEEEEEKFNPKPTEEDLVIQGRQELSQVLSSKIAEKIQTYTDEKGRTFQLDQTSLIYMNGTITGLIVQKDTTVEWILADNRTVNIPAQEFVLIAQNAMNHISKYKIINRTLKDQLLAATTLSDIEAVKAQIEKL